MVSYRTNQAQCNGSSIYPPSVIPNLVENTTVYPFSRPEVWESSLTPPSFSLPVNHQALLVPASQSPPSHPCASALVHTIIISLDCCTSLHIGLLASVLPPPSSLQLRFEQVLLIKMVNWFRVGSRIKCKLLSSEYKAIHSVVPPISPAVVRAWASYTCTLACTAHTCT